VFKINYDKILSQVADYHLPITVFVFLSGAFLQWFHHLDSTFVAFTATVLTAVTGHAFSKAGNKTDDPDKG